MLGLEDKLGTIRPGLAADLLVLGSDPARDIRATRDIRMVLRGGRVAAERMD